jgi:hypothetical protein
MILCFTHYVIPRIFVKYKYNVVVGRIVSLSDYHSYGNNWCTFGARAFVLTCSVNLHQMWYKLYGYIGSYKR